VSTPPKASKKYMVSHLFFRVSHVVLKLFDDSLHELSARRKLHDHPMFVILFPVRQVVYEPDDVAVSNHLQS
jgi:hypothetical protein